jgi:fatty acid desaturase
VFWEKIGITFGQFITILLIIVGAIPDIINTLKGKPTIIMSLLVKMMDLSKYLLKELTTGDQFQVMNALWAVAHFLFFLMMLFLFGFHCIRKSEFPTMLLILTISSVIGFSVIMHVCEKFTKPRY